MLCLILETLLEIRKGMDRILILLMDGSEALRNPKHLRTTQQHSQGY